MSAMLSRSGRSNADGKLTQRFDVPVSEELNEKAIIEASRRGIPKAEFLRDLLDTAITNGCWFPLSAEAGKALTVLCALHDKTPGEYLASMVESEVLERFSMQQMIAQGRASLPLDQIPMNTRIGVNT